MGKKWILPKNHEHIYEPRTEKQDKCVICGQVKPSEKFIKQMFLPKIKAKKELEDWSI